MAASGTELMDVQLGVAHGGGFGHQMAARQEKVADPRPDDWIDVDDENSILAQALTCRRQKCSRVLQRCREKLRSSWEQ